MQNHKNILVVCDANILIDYVLTDESLMKEVALYWKAVIVPDIVLHEVATLSIEKAKKYGLVIVETPLFNLPRVPGLSLQDSACLYFIRENNAVCLSNDKKLRTTCKKEKYKTVWGLEMLLFLVKEKQIRKTSAKSMAKAIHRKNTLITSEILSDFMEKLKII